jgi:hypothetical protein
MALGVLAVNISHFSARAITYVLSKAEDSSSVAIIPCGFEPLRFNIGFKRLFVF